MPDTKSDILVLPVNAVGRIDVGRLLRETEAIGGFLAQSEVRTPGTPTKMPKTSKLLDEILATNDINMLVEKDRKRLYSFLESVRDNAPILHMSFSADPSPLFIRRLVTWLRQEIHPLVLLQIGLQPNIGAGCIVRTTNLYFDFSLKTRFSERRQLLAHRLKGDL